MTRKEAMELLAEGIAAVEGGDTVYGLVCLEKCRAALDGNPLLRSYLGVCLARERERWDEAVSMCRSAISADRKNSTHYLNLGRIHVAAGRKTEAIRAFRDGLLYERNPMIGAELSALGWRKVPVFPGLGRENPVNIWLGKITRLLRVR